MNDMLKPHDWVKVKYGPNKGKYGRVSMMDNSGTYHVAVFGGLNGKTETIALSADNLEKTEPYVIDRKMLKDLCKAKLLYSDFAENVRPPFNIKSDEIHRLSIYDIRDAIANFSKRSDPITAFKEWFWLLTNILYDNLKIEGRTEEGFIADFPENEGEVFRTAWGILNELYWKMEARNVNRDTASGYMVKFENEPGWDVTPLSQDYKFEEAAFHAVCEDITGRIESYLKNRNLPEKERVYSGGQMKHFIEKFDSDDGLRGISDKDLKLYRKFVHALYDEGDFHAMRILAWGHYTGNRAFRQNWELSRKYLLELYEKSGDPFAANSLGYIYYYGRCNLGEPRYDEAFKYFSYGAVAGIDESVYKCADMLLYGRGTAKNIDMGLGLILEGYRKAQAAFCDGAYDNKFADYAMRMGNICRDNLVYGMGVRDAYRFYLEAEFAIKKRREIRAYYGDRTVENEIRREIENIQKRMKLDPERSVLKADFPIYINQIYDDEYPVKVYIAKGPGKGKYSLRIKRFRFEDDDGIFADDEFSPENSGKGRKDSEDSALSLLESVMFVPDILVTYPELSYANLVSELNFELEGVTILKKPEKGEYFLSDAFSRNDSTGALEFYSGGTMMAVIQARWYVIKVKKH